MNSFKDMQTRRFKTPRLEIYPERIKQNAKAVIKQCHQNKIKVACVTKVVSAHPRVARALEEAGADMLADSRLENIEKLRKAGFKGPFLLLRLPSISKAHEVVELADYSLNSSFKTLEALSEAACQKNLLHRVIIMIDVGDLREGTWPAKAPELVKKAGELKGLEAVGLGCNLACYGGVKPSAENMKLLIDTVEKCREYSGLELPVICGGNSSGLPIMREGKLPEEINLYRIGESIILGRNVTDRSPWPETRQDTFVTVGEVIEAEMKPSLPIGDRGQDAFGETQEFVDRGNRKRVICNLGRQDVLVDGITPIDEGIIVLGGSSDHLILDVHDSRCEYQVGDEIGFYPDYGALLALSTSEYVHKVVIEGE
ncbi:MAG: alanine/ornithine racemase family PLP-dependent enzyme [Candidatus Rifleibacteriota bacterium]